MPYAVFLISAGLGLYFSEANNFKSYDREEKATANKSYCTVVRNRNLKSRQVWLD